MLGLLRHMFISFGKCNRTLATTHVKLCSATSVFHGPQLAASEMYLNTHSHTLQNPLRKLFTPLDQFKPQICPRRACFMGDLIPPRCWLPLPVWPSLGRNVMALHRPVSPVCLCGSLFLTSDSLSFFVSLTSPGFDVLLLSHKPETCFLLTSNENSWPGLFNSEPEKHTDAHHTQMCPFAVRLVQAQRLYQPLVVCLMCGLLLSLLRGS